MAGLPKPLIDLSFHIDEKTLILSYLTRIKSKKREVEETAWQSKASTALAKDPSLAPRAHVRQLATITRNPWSLLNG